jgi:hypothetical protein
MVFTNWEKARLGIRISIGSNTSTHVIELPSTITYRTVSKYEIIHDITAWNNGVFEKPPEYTFTLAVPTLSISAVILRDLQNAGVPFNMEIYDINDTGEHKLISDILINCYIDTGEVNVRTGELVMAVFSGFALRYNYRDGFATGNNSATVTTTAGFGSGELPTNLTVATIFAKWAKVSTGT